MRKLWWSSVLLACAVASRADWVQVADLDVAPAAGSGLALSADGSTLVVGVDVFLKGSRGWADARRAARLLLSRRARELRLPIGEVKVSADGSVIAAHGADASGATSALYVYERWGSGWESGVETTFFGSAGSPVGVTADGSIVVTAVPGGLVVFERGSCGWGCGAEAARLPLVRASGGPIASWDPVEMDADGTVIVVRTQREREWELSVFERKDSGWRNATEVAVLKPGDIDPDVRLSALHSHAVSADGSTIAVRVSSFGYRTDEWERVVYVFSRGAGGWRGASEPAVLTSTPRARSGIYAVALSADGSRVATSGLAALQIWNRGARWTDRGTETSLWAWYPDSFDFSPNPFIPPWIVRLDPDGTVLAGSTPKSVPASVPGYPYARGPVHVFREVPPHTPRSLSFAQVPSSAKAGGLITPPVAVQLRDADGRPMFTAGVPVSLSLASGTGTLYGTLTRLTDGSGAALFDDLQLLRVGPKELAASIEGAESVRSGALTIEPARPFVIELTGPPQRRAQTGLVFQPLTVRLIDVHGNPVPNGKVVFTAPESGPTCSLDGAFRLAVRTDAEGFGSARCTAGSTAGSYPVAAWVDEVRSGGPSGSADAPTPYFEMTNVRPPPDVVQEPPRRR